MTRKGSNVKDVSVIDVNIGMKINQLRLALGKTRQDLAQQIGVTHQQLQKYEKGVNRITASRLVTVANSLNVPVTYFFEDTKNPLSQEQLVKQRMYLEMMRDFTSIKEEDQQNIVRKLIKVLAEV